jgi:Fic family protein
MKTRESASQARLFGGVNLFQPPALAEPELRVLGEVEEMRERLRMQLHEPRRWYGSLRRVTMARAIQGSNSIEGFTAKLDDAAAVEAGEEPMDADRETTLALQGYRNAMTYVLQLATEPDFEYSEQLLKSLHFMMTSYDLKSRPGRWRQGAIYVRNEATDKVVYEGADIADVPALVDSLGTELNHDSDLPALVRAGMAHLNLVMIHPFRDGNGRMARCLQTLVLAREGVLTPVFSSIEEYLGANTQAYYDVLAQVGGGRWQPERDTLPWIRFILTAHLRQARTLLQRVKEIERLWADLERIAQRHKLPERVIPALYDAAMGFRVRNATYRAVDKDAITENMASRDLRDLVDLGLLLPHGERRGRYYLAGNEVQAARKAIVATRDPRDDSDPFASAA